MRGRLSPTLPDNLWSANASNTPLTWTSSRDRKVRGQACCIWTVGQTCAEACSAPQVDAEQHQAGGQETVFQLLHSSPRVVVFRLYSVCRRYSTWLQQLVLKALPDCS